MVQITVYVHAFGSLLAETLQREQNREQVRKKLFGLQFFALSFDLKL